MKVVLAVALFVAIALAANPSPPTWPSAFSSSVFIKRFDNNGPRNDFVRWFYDSKQQLERFDGPAFWGGEFYLATIIRDHSSQTETSIFYQEDDVTCITGPINGTMPNPDFSQFNYIGVSVVDYEKTYHFIANDPNRHVFAQIFSKVSDGDLFRVDFSSWRGNEKITFHELDVAPQDPNVFLVPDLLQDLCNTVGAKH